MSGFAADERMEFLVERNGGEETLKREVHSIAPVVRRVRWVVDEFGGGVSAARVVADGEQILERDESQQ